jgi:hypothetical protein
MLLKCLRHELLLHGGLLARRTVRGVVDQVCVCLRVCGLDWRVCVCVCVCVQPCCWR